MLGRIPIIIIMLGIAASGCDRGLPSTVLSESPDAVLNQLRARGRAVDASLGGGRIRYLGFEAAPEGAGPGEEVRIAHYWVARADVDRPYQVFVHGLLQGAAGWIRHGDHLPVPSPDRWPIGAVVRDEHVLTLPDRLPANEVELRVGLYLGNERLPVDGSEQQDGQDRIRAGRFAVAGTPVPLPVYRAPRLEAPPVLDGRVDDREWNDAPWIAGLTSSRGDRPSSVGTRLRVAWDRRCVYVGWELQDRDLRATMKERDEPIYREEAVEMFIDPTRSRRDYVELQTSPTGVVFDARFTGGARQHADPGYDAGFAARVVADGTINDARDVDAGYKAEWQIDVASIPGAVAPLTAGTCWSVNFFRIAKDRVQDREHSDESAWSPPLMGDFHNLERFGELCFIE